MPNHLIDNSQRSNRSKANSLSSVDYFVLAETALSTPHRTSGSGARLPLSADMVVKGGKPTQSLLRATTGGQRQAGHRLRRNRCRLAKRPLSASPPRQVSRVRYLSLAPTRQGPVGIWPMLRQPAYFTRDSILRGNMPKQIGRSAAGQ